MTTYKFTLVTGVPCEITGLTGLQQRLLTEQKKGLTYQQRLRNVIKSILVKVGTRTEFDDDFLDTLTTEDKRLILVTARQFSYDFEDKFPFTFTWVDGEDVEQSETFDIDLKDGVFPVTYASEQYAEYARIERKRELTLKSGRNIRFNLQDGVGERIAAAIETPSALTLLETRVICEKVGDNWIKADLDAFSMRELDELRVEIRKVEGKVDTEIKFKHPDHKNLPQSEKMVTIDLINNISFFFPSGMLV